MTKGQSARKIENRKSKIENPLVLLHTVASRQLVACASDEARQRGIRPGMTLAEARALCPGLVDAPWQPEHDDRALAALGRWMMRFSPVVAVEGWGFEVQGSVGRNDETRGPSSVGSGATKRQSDAGGEEARMAKPEVRINVEARMTNDEGAPEKQGHAASPIENRKSKIENPHHSALSTQHSGLFLDLTGCDRLFGGFPRIIEQIDESLRAMGIRATLAIAPTPGAAWAIASAGGENGRIVAPHELRDALAPLPCRALRLEDQTLEALYHLGIQTIGQLLALPRESLPSRFGPAILTRIDQALGRVAEPLVPLKCETPIEAVIEFDGAVDSLETIWLAFKRLIEQVIAELARRGCGARRIEMRFSRSCAPPIRKDILLSRPSRDPRNLFDLMRCAMEGMGEGSGFRVRGSVRFNGETRNQKPESMANDEGRMTKTATERRSDGGGEGSGFRVQSSVAEPLSTQDSGLRTGLGTKARRHEGTGGMAPARTHWQLVTGNWQLLQSKIKNRKSKISPPSGFTAIRLAVPVFEPLAHQQIHLLEQEEHNAAMELDRLIERLVLRLGEEAVTQARLAESYLPERAYIAGGRDGGSDEATKRGSDGAGGGFGVRGSGFSGKTSQHSGLRTQDWAGHGGTEATPPIKNQKSKIKNPSHPPRPLCLLPTPREILVMVAPSHDRDGRPVSFTRDGQSHRVVHAIGPERIAGQWWEGHHRTRDYFTVEDESGRRLWIFRVRETGRWYVHGEF